MNLFKKLFSKSKVKEESTLVGITPAKDLPQEYHTKPIEGRILAIVLEINHKAFNTKSGRSVEVVIDTKEEANYIAKRFYDEGYKVEVGRSNTVTGVPFKILISW